MLPVMSSVKLPSVRFSTPVNESGPVAPASFPVLPTIGPDAPKLPVATLNNPERLTVSVPCFVVNTTVPAIVNTGGAHADDVEVR